MTPTREELMALASRAASPAQWDVIGKFDIRPRPVPDHGREAYLALIGKGVLEWAGPGMVRLTPLGLDYRAALRALAETEQ